LQLGLHPTVIRSIYRALLKRKHGADPRVDSVFREGKNVVRLGSLWATLGGDPYGDPLAPIINSLPAAQYFDPVEMEIGVDPKMSATLQQSFDLTHVGYPALVPVWGIVLNEHEPPTQEERRPRIVLYSEPLAPDSAAWARPRYVPADRRTGELSESVA